jgi:hypothetical protein
MASRSCILRCDGKALRVGRVAPAPVGGQMWFDQAAYEQYGGG